MSDASNASTLDLGTVKKWAKAQERQFKEVKKQLEKSEDPTVVLRALDVSDPGLRTFRNKARKLQREFPTPARFRSKVVREVDSELKRFRKLLELV
jgi:hypothetical protein